ASGSASSTGFIIRVTPAGQMLEHGIINQPGAIARGGPYSMVFTVSDEPIFGEIGLGGITVAHDLPGGKTARAFGVAHGPDGNNWFTGSIGSTSAVFVKIRLLMNVAPSSLNFTAPGQTQTITVTEQNYPGAWTAQSSNPGVATVAPGQS